MNNAAIWMRVSTKGQRDDGISLEAQERLDAGYAAEHGLTVRPEHIYREAHSGGELLGSVELTRLLNAARRHEFQWVIVDCLDRWVRDDAVDGWLDTELRQVGVKVVFVTETYTNDLAGRLQRSLKSQFAAEERRKISSRCRKAYQERLQQGKGPAIGPAPYGYQPERLWVETARGSVFKGTGVLLIDPAEAEIVRRIFRLLIDGHSLRSIARRLNDEATPPPSASESKHYSKKTAVWGVPTIARIVKNPVYRGARAACQQQSIAVDSEARLQRAQSGLAYSRKQVERPAAEWLSIAAPPLVSETEWHAAQAAVRARRGIFNTRNCESSERRPARPALLRGLVHCPVPNCGRRLHPQWRDNGRLIYRCSSHSRPAGWCGNSTVDGLDLEVWVKAQVEAFLRQPDLIQQELARREEQAGRDDLEADLEKQYRLQMAVSRKQERLLSLFAGAAEGELPVALIQQQLAAAQREHAGLETVIAALKARQEQRHAGREQGRLLTHYVDQVARKLQGASFAEWRRTLEALGIRVTARGGDCLDWRVEATLDPEGGEGVLLLGYSIMKQNSPGFTFILARHSGK